MEKIPTRILYPILLVAGVSVIAFSAWGIAFIVGESPFPGPSEGPVSSEGGRVGKEAAQAGKCDSGRMALSQGSLPVDKPNQRASSGARPGAPATATHSAPGHQMRVQMDNGSIRIFTQASPAPAVSARQVMITNGGNLVTND